MNRRAFLQTLTGAAIAGGIARTARAADPAVPSHLKQFADRFGADPHAAALEWFKKAAAQGHREAQEEARKLGG